MATPTDFREVLAALPRRVDAPVVDRRESEPSRSNSRMRGASPWQFSLWEMFRWLAVISLLFAILAAIGGAAAAVVLWIVALMAVHVAANAWGTKTWQPGVVRDEPAEHCPPRRPDFGHLAHAAPQSRISGEIRVTWAMIVCTVCGGAFGMALGGGLLMSAYGHTGRYGAIGFGTAAATVLGTFLGFLSSSFLDVALRSLWEAMRHGAPGSGAAVSQAVQRQGESYGQRDAVRRSTN